MWRCGDVDVEMWRCGDLELRRCKVMPLAS